MVEKTIKLYKGGFDNLNNIFIDQYMSVQAILLKMSNQISYEKLDNILSLHTNWFKLHRLITSNVSKDNWYYEVDKHLYKRYIDVTIDIMKLFKQYPDNDEYYWQIQRFVKSMDSFIWHLKDYLYPKPVVKKLNGLDRKSI